MEKNNATNRQGEDNCTNTTGNYVDTTLMPLQSESKHNHNWIKGREPPGKNIEISIRLYFIFNRVFFLLLVGWV